MSKLSFVLSFLYLINCSFSTEVSEEPLLPWDNIRLTAASCQEGKYVTCRSICAYFFWMGVKYFDHCFIETTAIHFYKHYSKTDSN